MEKVAFTPKGLTEPVFGGGTLLLEPYSAEDTPAEAEAPRYGPSRRWAETIVRFVIRRMQGSGSARQAVSEMEIIGPASRLTFKLALNAEGTSGPLVNAVMAPLLRPAAEDLANRIATRVEELTD